MYILAANDVGKSFTRTNSDGDNLLEKQIPRSFNKATTALLLTLYIGPAKKVIVRISFLLDD